MQHYHKAFWILLVIVLIACRKESDNRIPVVSFLYPQGELPEFQREGENIVFNIKDDQKIEQARIGWVNEDFIPLNNPEWIEVNSFDTTIHYWLTANDIQAGFAYIQIRVDDGEHTKLKYQAVNISEGPALTEKVIFGYNAQQHALLFSLDTAQLVAKGVLKTTSPLARIEGNGQDDLLALLSQDLSVVEVWSVKDSMLLWQKQAPFPEPKYSDWHLTEDAILLADYNSNLWLYHIRTGLVQVSASIDPAYRIKSVTFDQDFLYAAVHNWQADQKWLYVFYKVSGAFYKRYALNFLPLDLIPAGKNNQILMFSSDGLSTNISLFDLDTEVITLKKSISSFQFFAPVFHKNDNFYLHNDEMLKHWSFNTNSITNLATSQHIKGVAANGSGRFVFYLDGDFLKVIRPNSQTSSFRFDYSLNLITTISE
ncbi:MAG: hypothetical protein PHN50_04305 [Bacteroidales bacterium]|nr:hypothetical protein [Bacteroidales bacterium]